MCVRRSLISSAAASPTWRSVCRVALVDRALRGHDLAERLGHARVLAHLFHEPRHGFFAAACEPADEPLRPSFVLLCSPSSPSWSRLDNTHEGRAGYAGQAALEAAAAREPHRPEHEAEEQRERRDRGDGDEHPGGDREERLRAVAPRVDDSAVASPRRPRRRARRARSRSSRTRSGRPGSAAGRGPARAGAACRSGSTARPARPAPSRRFSSSSSSWRSTASRWRTRDSRSTNSAVTDVELSCSPSTRPSDSSEASLVRRPSPARGRRSSRASACRSSAGSTRADDEAAGARGDRAGLLDRVVEVAALDREADGRVRDHLLVDRGQAAAEATATSSAAASGRPEGLDRRPLRRRRVETVAPSRRRRSTRRRGGRAAHARTRMGSVFLIVVALTGQALRKFPAVDGLLLLRGPARPLQRDRRPGDRQQRRLPELVRGRARRLPRAVPGRLQGPDRKRRRGGHARDPRPLPRAVPLRRPAAAVDPRVRPREAARPVPLRVRDRARERADDGRGRLDEPRLRRRARRSRRCGCPAGSRTRSARQKLASGAAESSSWPGGSSRRAAAAAPEDSRARGRRRRPGSSRRGRSAAPSGSTS